ncbi:MAG: hypothetical protein H8E66_15450 [Planctomycetes bacterium]|nr:hypothetical protein [Planctomycetota bacterium]
MTLQARSWPMWLFVAIAVLLNVSLPPLFDWIDFSGFDREIQALIFVAGIIVGECCFVVLVSGLTKRTWLGAYLLGLGISTAGYAAILAGFAWTNSFNFESIAGFAMLPTLLLVAASPLYVLRHYFGWRLVLHGESPPPRQPLRLADIFSLIAIVASVLVLMRVPQVIWEERASSYWGLMAIVGLSVFGTSLIVLPIHARVALGAGQMTSKIAWLVLLAVMVVMISIGILQCFFPFDATWDKRIEILPYVLTFLGAAIGMFYLSLLLLNANGARVARGQAWKHGQEDEVSNSQTSHLQRLTWWRIGGAVAVTMASSIYLANLERWRAYREKENAILAPRAEATGGELGIYDRVPSNLTLGARATDQMFSMFTVCTKLKYLSLQDSQITDSGLANLQHFPELHTLTLNNMQITDEGVGVLIAVGEIDDLSLAHSAVTDACLRHLAQITINKLDISGTQISYNGLIVDGLPRVSTLEVHSEQFTQLEISQLERKLKIDVEVTEP